MTSSEQFSVALLTNAPAPYRTPFFNALSKECQLLVAFETVREPDREWAVGEEDFEFLWALTRAISIPGPRSRHGFVEQRVLHFPLNVVPLLNRFRPDVVISDELGARTASATVFCRIRRRPLIVWWEGTPRTEAGTGAMKAAVRTKLLQGATRVWGNGAGSASFLRANGVPESRVDLGMTGIDTGRWRQKVDAERLATRTRSRQELGVNGTVLLFVGSLTPRKGVRELLAALDLLSADRDLPQWSALFVGSGPFGMEVESWTHAHPAVPVASVGFVQPAALPRYFAAADVFVMPSLEDCWGLVCLEALVAGLPQVTSCLVGAAADLVTSREIGTLVDPANLRDLARHLADRIRLGPQLVPEALRTRAIRAWSTATMAERAMASIRSAVGDPSRATRST